MEDLTFLVFLRLWEIFFSSTEDYEISYLFLLLYQNTHLIQEGLEWGSNPSYIADQIWERRNLRKEIE